MNKKDKNKIIKALESKIKSIEKNKEREYTNKLDTEYEKLKSELSGLKKGFIIRKYKNFRISGSIGALIILISILFSITNFSYTISLSNISINLNNSLWNQLFYFGLSLFTISFIFYQIAESNKDKGRLMIAEMHIKRLIEIESFKKRDEDIQKMLRAIQKLDNLKSLSEFENTKDKDLKFMRDQIYSKVLKNKLKLFKKNK